MLYDTSEDNVSRRSFAEKIYKNHDTRAELLFWLLNPLLLRRPCCLCLPGCLKLPIQCLGARQVGYIFLQLKSCSNGSSML